MEACSTNAFGPMVGAATGRQQGLQRVRLTKSRVEDRERGGRPWQPGRRTYSFEKTKETFGWGGGENKGL